MYKVSEDVKSVIWGRGNLTVNQHVYKVQTAVKPSYQCSHRGEAFARLPEDFMRKAALLVPVLLFVLAFSTFAQQRLPDPSQVEIKAQKLTPNVYMLQFVGPKPGLSGGNVGVFVGDDGLVLTDTGYGMMAQKLEAALKQISDKPVKYILNTHWHGDHAGADAYFAKTATVVEQEFEGKKLAEGSAKGGTFSGPVRVGITFANSLTLHFDDQEIRIVHFPHGHTGGDCVILYPQAKVVQMGDDFVYPENPAFIPIDMDRDGSGGIQGAIAAADFVLANTPDDVKIIPGHGDLASKADLRKTVAVLKDTSAVMAKGIAQGKTLEQMQKEGDFAQWDYLNNSGHIKSDFYFERLYAALSQKGSEAAKSGNSQ